jgi:hypothetical protein
MVAYLWLRKKKQEKNAFYETYSNALCCTECTVQNVHTTVDGCTQYCIRSILCAEKNNQEICSFRFRSFECVTFYVAY